MLIGPRALKLLNSIEKMQLRMVVATFYGNSSAKKSSPATALPMLVKKRISSPFITSYPPLFVAFRNATFSSSVET